MRLRERPGDRAAQAVVDADLVDRIAGGVAERRQGGGVGQLVAGTLALGDDDALIGGGRVEIAVVERLQRRDGMAVAEGAERVDRLDAPVEILGAEPGDKGGKVLGVGRADGGEHR